MFCPKCGLRNIEASKFCRGCGVDLSYVMAAVEAKAPVAVELPEKYVEQFSRGVRGLFMGSGFMIVGIGAYLITANALPVSLFALLMAFIFLGTGFSRLMHAAGLKRLNEGRPQRALEGEKTEFIRPESSIYETGELREQPLSVTDRTTRRLTKDD